MRSSIWLLLSVICFVGWLLVFRAEAQCPGGRCPFRSTQTPVVMAVPDSIVPNPVNPVETGLVVPEPMKTAAELDDIDRRFWVANRYRLCPGSCGMMCSTHGSAWVLETGAANPNDPYQRPAPPTEMIVSQHGAPGPRPMPGPRPGPNFDRGGPRPGPQPYNHPRPGPGPMPDNWYRHQQYYRQDFMPHLIGGIIQNARWVLNPTNGQYEFKAFPGQWAPKPDGTWVWLPGNWPVAAREWVPQADTAVGEVPRPEETPLLDDQDASRPKPIKRMFGLFRKIFRRGAK